jgi:aryl-alcohol dehydrogenase-like predicted oxidoreductase
MQYTKLGRTGLKVSRLCLGTMNFGPQASPKESFAIMDRALERGINFFDTADVYGATKSEEFLGAALGSRRNSVVVATKFSSPVAGDDPMKRGGSRRWVMQACEDSLRRLGTDYIDLYQYHFPDGETPIEETLSALDDLVRQGKVRYIGSSNMTAWQAVEADWTSRSEHLTRFASAQNEYSLLNRRIERELVPACQKYGIGILPYFPLASGFLSGKYRRGEEAPAGTRLAVWGARGQAVLSDDIFRVLEGLEAFAEARGHTMLELAFGWLATHDYVPSVIAGATSPEQVAQNAKATEWRLTPEEMTEIDTLTKREKQS